MCYKGAVWIICPLCERYFKIRYFKEICENVFYDTQCEFGEPKTITMIEPAS